MYDFKVGLIGLGQWGRNIYRNLKTLNVIEKVYDNSLKNLSQYVNDKTIIAKNPDEMILSKDIDSIFIASPASTQEIYLEVTFKQKMFLLKPLCLSLDESYEIKKIADQTNKIVFVGHLLQYHNAFNK